MQRPKEIRRHSSYFYCEHNAKDEFFTGLKGELIREGRAIDRRHIRNFDNTLVLLAEKQVSYVDLPDVTGLDTEVQRASAKANVLFIYSLFRWRAAEKWNKMSGTSPQAQWWENAVTSELRGDQRVAETSHPVLTEKLNEARRPCLGKRFAIGSWKCWRWAVAGPHDRIKSYHSFSHRVKVKADSASTASFHTWLRGRQRRSQQS